MGSLAKALGTGVIIAGGLLGGMSGITGVLVGGWDKPTDRTISTKLNSTDGREAIIEGKPLWTDPFWKIHERTDGSKVRINEGGKKTYSKAFNYLYITGTGNKGVENFTGNGITNIGDINYDGVDDFSLEAFQFKFLNKDKRLREGVLTYVSKDGQFDYEFFKSEGYNFEGDKRIPYKYLNRTILCQIKHTEMNLRRKERGLPPIAIPSFDPTKYDYSKTKKNNFFKYKRIGPTN